MRKKYKWYQDALARVSVSAGTLSFISSASGVGLFRYRPPRRRTAGSGWGSIVSVVTGAIAKKVFCEVVKHEIRVATCESKANSIKDRVSRALGDNKICDEEFRNIISEVDKYHR